MCSVHRTISQVYPDVSRSRMPLRGTRKPGSTAHGLLPLGLNMGAITMPLGSERGLSLLEIAIGLVIAGIILGFSIPSYRKYENSTSLKSGASMIIAEMRLARQKALGIGKAQTLRFKSGPGYSIEAESNGAVVAVRSLPSGIRYDWTNSTLPDSTVVIDADGRLDLSGFLVIADRYGREDTVRVYTSGLVHEQ